MFFTISLISMFAVSITGSEPYDHPWELAIAIEDRVELLSANGTLMGTALPRFIQLKALTYDLARNQFVVSDEDIDKKNDTIYSFHLTQETDIFPIINQLPDDVQGLAIDPVEDVLYWTDAIHKTINGISLNKKGESSTLLHFAKEVPQDITIDSCKKFLYWTNANDAKPTIEKVSLDGTERKILISDDLFRPTGIAVDQVAERLYWADIGKGIYFRIESSNLEGKDRKVLYKGTHQDPYRIAVADKYVYWTDVVGNAIWRMSKSGDGFEPEKISVFEEKPMGLLTNNLVYYGNNCKELDIAIMENSNKSSVFYEVPKDEEKPVCKDCLNGGQMSEDCTCSCKRGFTGNRCENYVCHNYCVNGNCRLNSMGNPKCHCPSGHSGVRCESNVCDQYCLNGGLCNAFSSKPVCECPPDHQGYRCEFIISNVTTVETLLQQETGMFDFTQMIMIVSIISSVFIVIILTLARYAYNLKKTRPRIKKTIVVNKNVTPLTYRPQPPTEQCEITIENCCNMNVCETPCFEPPQFRGLSSKKDEKKNLLANMENPDDAY
ncbi:PREDICTED: protein cueball [Nicrophorus vespilloides]|uniref:Protein cueball n=1 Tax=Nicrophorus vespilloides TaxID=110193 RepID=A0ABM1MSL1_NICVS|nr:PREDICTED: protein cueball [Nicrophorus vespilloides]